MDTGHRCFSNEASLDCRVLKSRLLGGLNRWRRSGSKFSGKECNIKTVLPRPRPLPQTSWPDAVMLLSNAVNLASENGES
jgi:hypothetical protein